MPVQRPCIKYLIEKLKDVKMKKALLILNALTIALAMVTLHACNKDEVIAPKDDVRALNVSTKDTTGGYSSTTVALTGDQIRITPSLGNDTTTFITLTAETVNSYDCLNNILVNTSSFDATSLSIHYTGVDIPSSSYCTAGQKKATATNVLYAPVNGTYGFTVKLNGTTYTGSIVKNGSNYTFNWPYTSGVIVAPLSL
ncbi:hypothetical protein D3C72_531860 [compost metagenome]